MIKIMCISFFKLLQLTTIMIDYHAMNMRREKQKMTSQFPFGLSIRKLNHKPNI